LFVGRSRLRKLAAMEKDTRPVFVGIGHRLSAKPSPLPLP
jgi:hypothetical protein